MSETLFNTPLHDWHAAHGGRMVPFGGWMMPVQYTSIVEEHKAVRSRLGLFDISHMGRLDFNGPGTLAWLQRVTTNDVAKLKPGQIQYSLIANEHGGLVDDILVYRLPLEMYSIVCNATNREKVLTHIQAHRGGLDSRFSDQTFKSAMIALQGPASTSALSGLIDTPLADVKYYHTISGVIAGAPAFVSRTGYTGEDGFELIVPAERARPIWEMLIEKTGAIPCGLGARDTLRFEAAMPLYGHELSDEIDPFEAGIGWAVKLNKGDFVGRQALITRKANPRRTRVGLELGGKRIAREGAEVLTPGGTRAGAVTSGTFSPTLEKSLAMAYVDPPHAAPGTPLAVDIRGHRETAHIVPLPFYRRPSP